jgi:hypothetical protein
VADINGDGLPDIIATEPRNVVGYINHSRPDHFDETSFERVVLVTSPYNAFLVADFDGDGQVELMVESRQLFRIKFSDGRIVPQSGREGIFLQQPARLFAVADLTGDNRPELLGISGSSSLTALQNLGTGAPFHLSLRREPQRQILTITGQPTMLFHLQTSRDLKHWQTLTDLRLPASGEMAYSPVTFGSSVFFRVAHD